MMPVAHRLLHAAVALSATLAIASARAESGRLRVLTSFLPVHSLTVAVAGNRAEVSNWLPTGVDPHDFQFSPRDIRRLAEADLLVVGGLGLENWTTDQLRRLSGNSRLRLAEAAAGLPAVALIHDAAGTRSHDHDHDHDHAPDHRHEEGHAHGNDGGPNPHFWLDPLLMAHAVTNVVQALQALDPEGRAIYEANAAVYLAGLNQLHQDFEAGLRPLQGIPFLTFHNAFPYLARRYGLKLAGVVESTAAEEPSARELADLARLVRQEGVKVLFTDGPPTRLASRLAKDLGLRLARLETLETGDLKPGAYEAGMRRNLRALTTALRPVEP